jgi:hypothetical protein
MKAKQKGQSERKEVGKDVGSKVQKSQNAKF